MRRARGARQPRTVRRDEEVLFYPTYAVPARDGLWSARIHGGLFKSKARSLLRRTFLKLLGASLALPKNGRARRLLAERLRPFLRDNKRGRRLVVEIGGKRILLGPTGKDGTFQGTAMIHLQRVSPAIEVTTEPRAGDGKVFHGWVWVVPREGLSIVSDVDDTVKISEVSDRGRLLARTFLEEHEAAPGMAAMFRRWKEAGARFHYVSTAPWHTLEALRKFLKESGFPDGTMHLQAFRAKDRRLFNLFAAPDAHKRSSIQALLRSFPRRRFVLVGDDGERDPEIYAGIARRHPGRVERILIRRVRPSEDDARLERCFRGLPRRTWAAFRDPAAVRR